MGTILFSVYRPPDTQTHMFEESLVEIEEAIGFARANTLKFPNLLILGDFNFPDVKWPDGVIPMGQSQDSIQANLLMDLMDTLFMFQLVTIPTRGANILDLVFTNCKEIITAIVYLVNAKVSDHESLRITTNLPLKKQKKGDYSRDFYSMDIPKFNLKDADEEDWVKYNLVIAS